MKRTKASRGPIRKVVGEWRDAHGALLEVLECGHRQLPRADMIGPTNAYRRRCRQCKKEKRT